MKCIKSINGEMSDPIYLKNNTREQLLFEGFYVSVGNDLIFVHDHYFQG